MTINGSLCSGEEFAHLLNRLRVVVEAMDREAIEEGGDGMGPYPEDRHLPGVEVETLERILDDDPPTQRRQ